LPLSSQMVVELASINSKLLSEDVFP